MDLGKKENLIIELLKTKEKMSFQQMYNYFENINNESQNENPFKNKNSLTRVLEKLLSKRYIYYTTDNVPYPYRKQYFITEKYYEDERKEQEKEFMDLSQYIYIYSSKFRNYLNMFDNVIIYNLNEEDLCLFIASCISYYYKCLKNLDYKNFNEYKHFIMFAVINHPDQTFAKLKDFFDFESKINEQLIKFQKDKKIEFFLKSDNHHKNYQKQQNIYILLKDDPILFDLAKEIEEKFNYKFLIFLKISEKFKGLNFDFLLQFGYSIFIKYLESIKNENLIKFFDEFIIPFQIFIREIILRNLERQNKFLPYQLLPYENKNNYLNESIFKKPTPLTKREIIFIEEHLTQNLKHNNKINEDLLENIKNNIKNLYKLINDSEDLEKLIYKSHLLVLIRILLKILGDKRFKELKEFLGKDKIMSYSKYSDEIYSEIKNYQTNIKMKFSHLGEFFIIYNLCERLDHLSNIIKLYKENLQNVSKINKIKKDILDIFEFSEKILRNHQKFPIKIKIFKLFLNHGNDIVSFKHLLEIVEYLIKYFQNNKEAYIILIKIYVKIFLDKENNLDKELKEKILKHVKKFLDNYNGIHNNIHNGIIEFFINNYQNLPRDFDKLLVKNFPIKRPYNNYNIPLIEKDQYLPPYIKNNIIPDIDRDSNYRFLKKIIPFTIKKPKLSYIENNRINKEYLDTNEQLFNFDLLIFNNFSFEFIEYLRELILMINSKYGKSWAIRYLENYIDYLIYFFKIRNIPEIIIDDIILNFNEFEKIIKIVLNYIYSSLYWENREANTAIKYMKKISKFKQEITEKFNIIFNNSDKYPKVRTNYINLNRELEKSEKSF
ncbi:MAG: hypothetical protein ACTSPY_05785 [Candidatus Helarchaeota archaeon]